MGFFIDVGHNSIDLFTNGKAVTTLFCPIAAEVGAPDKAGHALTNGDINAIVADASNGTGHDFALTVSICLTCIWVIGQLLNAK